MENQNEMWALVELMGHGKTAGIVRKSDLGGLLRVDVPVGNEGFRTEYYGEQAIYAIRCVSEEIARAYALPEREICAYDEPIVPRAQYEEALQKARTHVNGLEHRINVLQNRLTQVNSLPEPSEEIESIPFD
jgi:hypothetical protein